MNYEQFSETKRLIFETSVTLFSEQPFESVTINDIAHAVNKTKSSLYNHFASKQEIMDSIYDFFCQNFNNNRLTMEQIKPIIENGSIMDIIHSVMYVFGPADKLMIPILRIIHQRKYFDNRARDIVRQLLINDGVEYARQVFDSAVELGRLAPFDTYSLSLFCSNSRLIIYDKWILNPTVEYYQELCREQDQIYEYAASLITDLQKIGLNG